MTHVRVWQFDVPDAALARFEEAYGPQGDWARLFATAPGFRRTELWRAGNRFLTFDHWDREEDFEAFQRSSGEAYRALDAALEGLAGAEIFIGAFDRP